MNIEAITGGITRSLQDANPMDIILKLAGIILAAFSILVVFNLIQFFLGKFLKGRISDQRNFMIKKGIRYTGFVLALLFVFRRMGIDTTALLGAAGIAGIVIGFAAQTSVSSLISGFFLLSEKPFTVGDTIKVDNITGVVLSVDLLSVKLQTFDNLFVRIPNETISKSTLITITRFPIRRLDLSFSVAYKEDLERVGNVLLELAAANRYCLENPAPFFGVDSFGDSGINLIFNLWFEKSNFWNLKNSILTGIKKRFETEGIEIPCQKITIAFAAENTASSQHR
ncbi:MAG: mechanosensitive ion channel family protein [Spirochaetaceae bacterium]|jgi:small-conductance mechanosensitive channel|nr:mechanosensitive ion channel family protein [Spirochaetaceae bacterium]